MKYSPWVCNCGHSWANHTQSTSRTQMPSMIMRSSNDQNHQEMQEMISDVMKNDAMNDMKSDMMYRRDGER